MLNAVSNSGPFIHLSEINQLKLFSIFKVLIIPSSVVKEIGKIGLRNIKIIDVPKNEIKVFIRNLKEFNLQQAEIDALYLAKRFSAIFLTDDLEARAAANKLKIEVHGSIGIIALAYHKNLLSLKEAKQAIINLYENSTLFLTRSLVDLSIQKLEKNKL